VEAIGLDAPSPVWYKCPTGAQEQNDSLVTCREADESGVAKGGSRSSQFSWRTFTNALLGATRPERAFVFQLQSMPGLFREVRQWLMR